jgi:protein-S-isoprenylcysteine O-methyltransferase Ste14
MIEHDAWNYVCLKGGTMRKNHGNWTGRLMELALLVVLPIAGHYLLPIMTIVPRPYTYLGIAVMLLGLALATWGSMTFRNAGAGFQLHGENAVLVTSGPFQITRNPMYLGMLIWVVGLSVLLGSLTALLYPILIFGLVNFALIPPEEKNLERLFGAQYDDYRQRVRRWL